MLIALIAISYSERFVTKEEGIQFAKQNNLIFFEVSANGLGVNKVFEDTAKLIYHKLIEKYINENSDTKFSLNKTRATTKVIKPNKCIS